MGQFILFVVRCVSRYLINPDQTLQLHYMTAQDAGKYTCTAANHVGAASATAHLQVEGEFYSFLFFYYFTAASCYQSDWRFPKRSAV